ncbi:hypothetical protein NW766_006841 [Fusarium irregulare]|uniref:Ankyrin n=1 Tax=Fusarium irregulare TaxID=2494466 RepID=A0A9W8U8F0_9HYPO|nr:hypothetical protein NW766_006841 [Fusarium irregulare]
MCKFLLEEGLDVDHVAPEYWDDELHNCLQRHYENPYGLLMERNFKRVNACRKLLLAAGADPTYKDPNKSSSKSFLDNIKTAPNRVMIELSIPPKDYVTWDTVDLAWNSGLVTPFANFHDWRNWEGMSAFLSGCTHHKTSVDVLKRLVTMGANIHDRSGRGESCLHLLVGHTCSETAPTIRLECLVYILKQGVDPYVQDAQGRTASDIAYNMLGPLDIVDGTIGDIWDAALHISGYDVAEFRATRRRRPRYYFSYTRQLFEELWKGKEDECPYWNDEPWPPLGPEEQDSDRDSVCTSYGCVSDFGMSDDEDILESRESEDDDEDGGAMLE